MERGRDSKTSDILRRCWRDSRESIQGGRKEGRKVLRRDAAGGARKATRTGWVGVGVFCLSNIKELVANFTVLAPYPSRPGSYETVFHLVAHTHDAFQAGVPEFRAIV